jgi:nucleoside-diphosphate-sugar epimerase
MTRILVIGGTRFIGAHVTSQLFAQGAEVTVYHRGRTQHPRLPPVAHVCSPSAEYPVLHFPAALRRDWDVIIHMVAMGEADALAAAEAFEGRAGRLVLISSGDVYRAYGRLTRFEPGPPDPVPLTEDAPLRTRLYPYRGQENALGSYVHDYEKILAERAVMDSAIPWTVLRLPKVYGPEDNADLRTIYMAASNPAWQWTHGHVENVAAAIVLATLSARAAHRIYNVGEAQTPTMGERLARLPAAPAVPPPPFDFVQSMEIDTARIRDELGYAELLDEATAMRDLAFSRRAARVDPGAAAGYTPASSEGT